MVYCAYLHYLPSASVDARISEAIYFHSTHILKWPVVFQIAKYEKSLIFHFGLFFFSFGATAPIWALAYLSETLRFTLVY
jgi:hypothetical protein